MNTVTIYHSEIKPYITIIEHYDGVLIHYIKHFICKNILNNKYTINQIMLLSHGRELENHEFIKGRDLHCTFTIINN